MGAPEGPCPDLVRTDLEQSSHQRTALQGRQPHLQGGCIGRGTIAYCLGLLHSVHAIEICSRDTKVNRFSTAAERALSGADNRRRRKNCNRHAPGGVYTAEWFNRLLSIQASGEQPVWFTAGTAYSKTGPGKWLLPITSLLFVLILRMRKTLPHTTRRWCSTQMPESKARLRLCRYW